MQTNEQRLAILDIHANNGVSIPCPDSIMIDEHTTIGAGSIVYPGTILRNCTVGSGVTLNHVQAEDCVIGDGCTLGPWVHLRPGTVLGKGVRVGNFVELKNTQVGSSTKISHLSYLGDATVGEQVNVGCGLAVANYGGQQGVKHRTVIGDGAFIGCNNAIVAPVTVGENAYTAAGSTITEDVPPSTLAIARARQVNKARTKA